jgi:hypothetical protein
MIGNTYGGLDNALRNFESIIASLGYDVKVYLNTNTFSKGMSRKEEPRSNDAFFDLMDEDFHFRQAEMTVIFNLNWPTLKNWNKGDDSYKLEAMKPIRRQTDLILDKKNNGKLIYINVGHRIAQSEKLGVKLDNSIFKHLDSFITFGTGDEIVKVINSSLNGTESKEFLNKVHYMQHNTLFDKSRKNWRSPEDKYRMQFYWQGRTPAWKGWIQWLDFKQRCANHHIDINLCMNGLMPSIGTVSKLTVSLKPKVFKPFLEYHKKNKTDIHFSNTLEDKAQIYGLYDPKVGERLISESFVGMYTSFLDPKMNLLPEYVTLEIIQNGTVLAVPSMYRGTLMPDRDLSEFGMLALPSTDDDSLWADDSQWDDFSEKYRALLSSDDYYDQFRERAYDYFIGSVDFNARAVKILDTVR